MNIILKYSLWSSGHLSRIVDHEGVNQTKESNNQDQVSFLIN